MKKSILDTLSINNANTKIQDLLIEEIIYLKNTMPFDKYCIFVVNYLYSRIKNNITCTDDEIPKLKTLHSNFNCDERTTLKYMHKLYNYIDELIYISKNKEKQNKEKNKLNDLTIRKLIHLKEKISVGKFVSYVNRFISRKFEKKEYLDEQELTEIKLLFELINEDEKIRDDQKKGINKSITKLIVFSKNKDRKNFLKRISNLSTLTSKNDLYRYFETVIKYAYFCIEENALLYLIYSFKNDSNYIGKIIELLKDSPIANEYKYVIDEFEEKERKDKLFSNDFPNLNINYDYLRQNSPLKENKNVITIDEEYSPDLDGAFSIEKKGDTYILEVYVTDVPSFLLQNEELMKEAYKRSTSMYNSQNKNRMLIKDMLPRNLSHDLLSLKKDHIRNVITFTYLIDLSGNVSLEQISKNSVYINDNIRPETANSIILSQSDDDRTHRDLKIYKDVCELISSGSKEKFLKEANMDRIYNIIGVPSIITNYHIGNNSDFAIYRDMGLYTKESDSKYTHSVTPLRKFVSNINLVFYLNQLGIINCPDKYLYYVQDHLDEIIDHLNEQEKTKEIFQKNRRLIKKYYE